MQVLSRCLLTLALAVALFGCRSAGRGGPAAAPAALPAELQAWVGQKRLLAGVGDSSNLAFKAGDAAPQGDCDVAVEVLRVDFQAGKVTLGLATLGRAEVAGRARGRGCDKVPFGRQLSVTGLGSAEQAPALLERWLKTPEALLAARDQAFDLPADPRPPVLAARGNEMGEDAERRLGRQVTAWPKPLLSVHALVQAPSGKLKQSSEVPFLAVVGADGRVYRPEVRGGLSAGHEETVRKLLGLWRYEPARKGTERVAAYVDGRLTLQLY